MTILKRQPQKARYNQVNPLSSQSFPHAITLPWHESLSMVVVEMLTKNARILSKESGVVAMPVIFRFNGIEYRLWSDDHDPAHIYVRPAQASPEWEIIVYLGNESDGSTDSHGKQFGDTTIVKGKVKLSQINELLEYLKLRRAEAWGKWKEIHG
jgi:hypothetical protein